MKLVLAIVSNQAAEGITDGLLAAGFRATRLASTGGFRREGNTTIMVGVDDDDVEPALAIFKSGAQVMSRKQAAQLPQPESPSGRGAVFVLPLEGYFHL
ncbi:MAG: cyclic-di-AMP receptor [Chloroflexota bacterium]|nr:cyclic-di-AMP receptor [Chloroflexota bacterium]